MFGNLRLLEEVESVVIGGKKNRVMKLQCVCGTVVEKQLKVLRLSVKCCGCSHRKPGYPPTIKVGDTFLTNEGYYLEVVKYNKSSDILVQFKDSFKTCVKVTGQNLRRGGVCNPYHKSVLGVGCYGEPNCTWKEGKQLYSTWAGMIERVNCEKFLNKAPAYRSCTIVDEWYCFANFYEWAIKQKGCHTKTWQLDKDLLVKGNKIYSPETCCFIPPVINGMLTKREAKRGNFPIGVHKMTVKNHRLKPFRAVCCNGLTRSRVGKSFSCPTEAFIWYKHQKEETLKEAAEKYKDVISQEAYAALYKYEVSIED